MSRPVKRPYRSTLRADQALATRRRIRDAAERLFLERGYADTSMDEVAAAAGVARQTVFSAFGSKTKLLKEVIDVRLAGDEAPVALADRPDADRVRAEPDPVRLLRLHARVVAEAVARVRAVYQVMIAASAVDAEIAELLRSHDEARLEGIGAVVDVLHQRGALTPDRSVGQAKEAIWLLTGPVPALQALSRGWSMDDYERWLGDCFIGLLLPGRTG